MDPSTSSDGIWKSNSIEGENPFNGIPPDRACDGISRRRGWVKGAPIAWISPARKCLFEEASPRMLTRASVDWSWIADRMIENGHLVWRALKEKASGPTSSSNLRLFI
ncbi:hypothetical protein CDAR_600281 [Caerostris darwini]|uniref:Uncharacterized protein n=1 Tax=Caerostris darwini TaxID=1538125 RepID=A0AAV4ST12_9ARAC|nr:hypothetical protein CDAR_600281 [Caerostris darwini]